MSEGQKLQEIERVLREELIQGHSPIKKQDVEEVQYLRGREANKSWADDVARKCLAIIRGK